MRKLILLLTLLVGSCGSSSDNACDPGDQKECACVSGEKGAQSCLTDGSGWSECRCPACSQDTDCPEDSICISGGCGLVYPESGRTYNIGVKSLKVHTVCRGHTAECDWDPEYCSGGVCASDACMPDLIVGVFEGEENLPPNINAISMNDLFGATFFTAQWNDRHETEYISTYDIVLTATDQWHFIAFDADIMNDESGIIDYEYIGALVAEPIPVSSIRSGELKYEGDGVDDCIEELVVGISLVE